MACEGTKEEYSEHSLDNRMPTAAGNGMREQVESCYSTA